SSQSQPMHQHSGTPRAANATEPTNLSPSVNFALPPEPTPSQPQRNQQQQQQHMQQQPFSPTATDIQSFPSFPDGSGGNNPFSREPSAFPFSPSSFPQDTLFNIAPTPPSNPQYATFP